MCAVLVETDSRDRAIICDRGAAGALQEDYVMNHSELHHILSQEGNLVFATAYNLTTDNRFNIIRELAKKPCKFALGLSSAALIQKFHDRVEPLLSNAEIVVGNVNELLVYSKEKGWPTDSPEECASRMSAGMKDPGIVVCTDGANPYLYASKAVSPGKLDLLDGSKPEVTGNTNGAGDSFAGCFLGSLLQHDPEAWNSEQVLIDAIKTGHECAQKTIAIEGTLAI